MRLGKVKHIFSRDPAIDRTDEAKVTEALKHSRDTGEKNGVPVREGRTLAIWQLQSLSDRGYTELTRFSALNGDANHPTRREALRRGLIAVEGALDEDGRPLRLEFQDGGPGGQVVTDATLDRIHRIYGPRCVGELGQRVIDVTEADPT